MIRRDYFIKLIQELSAVLLRIVSLKARREYAAALHEIDCALEKYLSLKSTEATAENLDQVLSLCGREEGPVSERLNLLAEIFVEKANILMAQEDREASRHAALLALGLYLEAVQSGTVSLDLLKKIDDLLASISEAPLPTPILSRLGRYLEDRGLYAKAEDVLCELVERDPLFIARGIEFYERLLQKSDEDLAAGNLPRDEVLEGRVVLVQRLAAQNFGS